MDIYEPLYQKEYKSMADHYGSIYPEASKRTLQRELKELLDMNLLDAKGNTNNRIYILKLVTEGVINFV